MPWWRPAGWAASAARSATLRIGEELLHADRERQVAGPDALLARQDALGNGDHFVRVGVGGINHRQLGLALGFGVVLGLAFAQVEGAFAREQVGQELAEQQQDQPDMHHPEADLAGA